MGVPTITVAAAKRPVMNASPLSSCHHMSSPSTVAAAMMTQTPIQASLAVGL
jgi:hypothetical protein